MEKGKTGSEKDGSRKIDPQTQTVTLDGALLAGKRRLVVMLNKPAGFLTATEDAEQKTVMELLPKQWAHLDLKPVGRLDKETEGLLLFTNDGDLLHRLISPKQEVPKVYYARHEGQAGEVDVAAFSEGLTLRDGSVCRPAVLEPLGPGESLITVCEGKYHQVRRMMAARNMTVTYLQRRQEGPLSLGTDPPARDQNGRLVKAALVKHRHKLFFLFVCILLLFCRNTSNQKIQILAFE